MLVAEAGDDLVPGGHQNLTAFLVEKPVGYGEVLPGHAIPGKIDKMGYKGVDTTEMVFDGFRVGASAVLGGVTGALPSDP